MRISHQFLTTRLHDKQVEVVIANQNSQRKAKNLFFSSTAAFIIDFVIPASLFIIIDFIVAAVPLLHKKYMLLQAWSVLSLHIGTMW